MKRYWKFIVLLILIFEIGYAANILTIIMNFTGLLVFFQAFFYLFAAIFVFLVIRLSYSTQTLILNSTQKLNDSEQRYRDLFENSTFVILLIDPEGKIVECNNRIVELPIKYDKEDVIGKKFIDLLKKLEITDDIELFYEDWSKLMIKQGYIEPIEFRYVNKEGIKSWMSLQSTIISIDEETYIQVIIRNITERKDAEIKLKHKLEVEKIISKISSRFIGTQNIDDSINNSLQDFGKLTNANRSYLFMFDENKETMKNIHEWCEDGVSPLFKCKKDLQFSMVPWWINKIMKGDIIRIDNVALMPDDALSEINNFAIPKIKSLIILPLIIERKISGFIGFDYIKSIHPWNEDDVTMLRIATEIIGNALNQRIAEQKLKEFREELERKVEDRTRELNNSLEQQKLYLDQLLKSSQFKTHFLASVSHELRTPLNAIIGFTDLLLDLSYGELNNSQLEFLNDIKSSSDHLLEMITHILDISKIEAGQLILNFKHFSVVSIISQIKSTLRPLYIAKNLRFRVNGVSSKNKIYADPIRFKEILFNLLSNAIKYSFKGEITINFQEKSNNWLFEIKDTGMGIASQDRDLIFSEFKRVNSLLVKSIAGTGLGLPLTKRLVNLHGGKIWFESELGKGTSFYFTIPKVHSNAGVK